MSKGSLKMIYYEVLSIWEKIMTEKMMTGKFRERDTGIF